MDRHAHADVPSAWVARFIPLIAPGGTVLDLACGGGRHARLLAARGLRVIAADRDSEALARAAGPGITCLQVDLETGGRPIRWPFAAGSFAGIVVANYLHRPLLGDLVDALSEGGVLIYETFAEGNQCFGKPSNPDFLLLPGELLTLAAAGGLRVVAFEDGYSASPRPAMVQRLCAVKAGPETEPGRLALE
jgi:SAM-dependent methyltransferase